MGYCGGMLMDRSHRPPWYGDAGSRGPRRTASQLKRSESEEGPRWRQEGVGWNSRSESSWERRLSADWEEDDLGDLDLEAELDALEEERDMVV
jgi:hypothetical protein